MGLRFKYSSFLCTLTVLWLVFTLGVVFGVITLNRPTYCQFIDQDGGRVNFSSLDASFCSTSSSIYSRKNFADVYSRLNSTTVRISREAASSIVDVSCDPHGRVDTATFLGKGTLHRAGHVVLLEEYKSKAMCLKWITIYDTYAADLLLAVYLECLIVLLNYWARMWIPYFNSPVFSIPIIFLIQLCILASGIGQFFEMQYSNNYAGATCPMHMHSVCQSYNTATATGNDCTCKVFYSSIVFMGLWVSMVALMAVAVLLYLPLRTKPWCRRTRAQVANVDVVEPLLESREDACPFMGAGYPGTCVCLSCGTRVSEACFINVTGGVNSEVLSRVLYFMRRVDVCLGCYVLYTWWVCIVVTVVYCLIAGVFVYFRGTSPFHISALWVGNYYIVCHIVRCLWLCFTPGLWASFFARHFPVTAPRTARV